MKTRSLDLLSIWAAQAPIWCTAQAMPMTPDQYTLLAQTFMDEVMNLKFWKERKKFTSEEVEEKILEWIFLLDLAAHVFLKTVDWET